MDFFLLVAILIGFDSFIKFSSVVIFATIADVCVWHNFYFNQNSPDARKAYI